MIVTDLGSLTSPRVVGRPTRDGGQAEAARRILDVAAPMFYGQGVRAISADAVIEAARVTKATFYRHYPTKDDLVVAYLHDVSDAERRALQHWRSQHPRDPARVLERYARTVGTQACGPEFRGCPFLNAIAAHPDPTHPVRIAAEEHRAWLRSYATDLLTEMGVRDAGLVSVQLVMLRDGAMATGDDVQPGRVTQALLRAGAAVVRGA
ncbi:TetR/AcrR family transcriptional regulator [Actinotalea sp. BY-33]|uniref:TetR/AcrR family transcriptional regulator n=1 Tax=Actinotalea soli TaxID=2819234 RepID=A0A939LRK8_9CELL|nr:TetR/AcrR family transcriptional regulator [Actinotalea soli]MBO1753417.1 TetR/AcrR family transcriptional regulator [Actinotalea soli]